MKNTVAKNGENSAVSNFVKSNYIEKYCVTPLINTATFSLSMTCASATE